MSFWHCQAQSKQLIPPTPPFFNFLAAMAGVLQPHSPCPLPCPKTPFPREGAHCSPSVPQGLSCLPGWISLVTMLISPLPQAERPCPQWHPNVLAHTCSNTSPITALDRKILQGEGLSFPTCSLPPYNAESTFKVCWSNKLPNQLPELPRAHLTHFHLTIKKKFSVLSFCKLLWSNGVPQCMQ